MAPWDQLCCRRRAAYSQLNVVGGARRTAPPLPEADEHSLERLVVGDSSSPCAGDGSSSEDDEPPAVRQKPTVQELQRRQEQLQYLRQRPQAKTQELLHQVTQELLHKQRPKLSSPEQPRLQAETQLLLLELREQLGSAAAAEAEAGTDDKKASRRTPDLLQQLQNQLDPAPQHEVQQLPQQRELQLETRTLLQQLQEELLPFEQKVHMESPEEQEPVSGAMREKKLDALLQRASGLLESKSWQSAEETYEMVVELAPLDFRAHQGKALALAGQGRYLQAFGACRRGLGVLPDCAELKELKEVYRRKHKEQKAERDKPQPAGPAHLAKEEAREAVDLASDQLAAAKTDAEKHLARGMLQEAMDRFSQAADQEGEESARAAQFTAAAAPSPVALSPKKRKLEDLLQKASGFLELKAWQSAEQAYEIAVELAPRDWRTHQGKALALQGQGRFLKAFSASKVGLEQLPGNVVLQALMEQSRTKFKGQRDAEVEKQSAERKLAPSLTKEQARQVMSKAMEHFEESQNLAKIKAAIDQCRASSSDPSVQQMAIQTTMLPMVQKVLGPELEQFGFDANSTLDAMMQIQFLAAGDQEMQAKVMRVMNFLMTGVLAES
ncbi:unnamed protein product [Polarella glacialis]|uniref:Protein C10 n=2 Tax=Polarella glacialis TaxID=89957 RepID=A0A813DH30_POLGL|nr:unnamed protein product [Polarella glacialis]|mmetsp:Transcript_36347/g.65723  ORF Transcript_36347/g.65723 Transcript_36347/m.65723 type:complete len:610 (+) Transcript_36347:53-1882(+)